MDKRPIGIFDSGVGGLTVFSEIAKQLPKEDLIYLGDTKNFPYGDKSKETIIKISTKCTKFLISKHVKMIIIACGTATSQALEKLKEQFGIPIVGIITPTILDIKKAAQKQNMLRVGVMATEGTINSRQWEYQLKKEIENIEVISKSCPLLAPMAEQGWINNEVARLTIKEYIKSFEENEVDKLILGCTHYPLFKALIKERLGNKVDIINTGEKIANYLQEYLKEHKLDKKETTIPKYEYYLTDLECNFIQVAKSILKEEFQEKTIKKVEIE